MPPPPPPVAIRRGQRGHPKRTVSAAFSLVELLVVISVILVILGIATPVVTAMKGAGDVNKAVYDIAGVLEQSRTYAMSNNTYVYVGIAEVDVSKSDGATPQTAGNGRIGLAVVATKDGTQGFSTGDIPNWSGTYSTKFANNLTVVGKPLVFDNLHVPADLGAMPASGGMVRPALNDPAYSVGNTGCVSATPFDYPVAANNLGRGKYSFRKVVQFDPQGIARIQTTSNPTSIVPYLEIDLQQTRGTTVPALPTTPGTGNVAAIQIDGMTGAVRIYRP